MVETLSVEFDGGLTVLTGETGAGKSILVDALSLVLGARSTAQMVRAGAERAEVTALFDISQSPEVRAELQALELDEGEDELHLRRTVASDGRSRAYVNGRPVPAQTLRGVGSALVDIHGQHEHQTLLDAAVQRQLLDLFGGHASKLDAVGKAHARCRALVTERDALLGESGDGEARRALLDYQVEELDELAPQPDEFERSRLELGALSRAEGNQSHCAEARALLEDDDGVESRLARAHALIDKLADDAPEAQAVSALLETAGIHVSEALGGLRDLADTLVGDPVRAAELERRLDALHGVARKHHVEPERLSVIHEALRDERDRLAGASTRLTELGDLLIEARRAYDEAAARLGDGRRRAGKRLGRAITANMSELGMPGGRCELSVSPLEGDGTRPEGNERIDILVSANPGMDPAPLRKVASGGELSRISLAIQVLLAGGSGVPTLVFDEVDVGIGGGVAEIVGKRLREVAGSRQVLCVTHLAQVACQGHGHLRVAKQARGKTTRSMLTQLDGDERVEEVARMLGGLDITERTRAHAREMLDVAASKA